MTSPEGEKERPLLSPRRRADTHRIVFRVMSLQPGYRSNLGEMGERQGEILDRSRFRGGDTNLLVPLSHIMVEQNVGPLPPTSLQDQIEHLPPLSFYLRLAK